MTDLLTLLTDLTIIVFDLTVFTRMFALRRDDRLHRGLMYGGCALIVLGYYMAAYRLCWPASLASSACLTAPSFLLFFWLSKYRDSRFILTFCFVDTVSLMVAFVGRALGLFLPGFGSALALAVVLALSAALLLAGRPHFRRYHQLLEMTGAGWGFMALATVLIYFALIFFAAYPSPLVGRPEYYLNWLVFAAVVLVCYAVFLQSLQKTWKLRREQELFHMAYTDALTGLYNRASYIEQINELQRRGPDGGLCCVMLDCNGLKAVNDTLGHHAGDELLRRVAQALRRVFSTGEARLFRIGGDEFALLLTGVDEAWVRARLEQLHGALRRESGVCGIPLSVAAGCACSGEAEGVEALFVLADRRMYENKKAGRARPATEEA